MDFNNNIQSDSAFAQFLINKGIAKDENSANAIMIIFVIISFAFSIYMVMK